MLGEEQHSRTGGSQHFAAWFCPPKGAVGLLWGLVRLWVKGRGGVTVEHHPVA